MYSYHGGVWILWKFFVISFLFLFWFKLRSLKLQTRRKETKTKPARFMMTIWVFFITRSNVEIGKSCIEKIVIDHTNAGNVYDITRAICAYLALSRSCLECGCIINDNVLTERLNYIWNMHRTYYLKSITTNTDWHWRSSY